MNLESIPERQEANETHLGDTDAGSSHAAMRTLVLVSTILESSLSFLSVRTQPQHPAGQHQS